MLAVGGIHALAHRPALVDVVDLVVVGRHRARHVDDRHAVEVVADVDDAVAVGDGECVRVGHHALGLPAIVDVDGADLGVEIGELGGADPAGHQGTQAVLHADVVVRSASEADTDLLFDGPPALGRARTEDVAHVVLQRAAHSGGVGVRAIHLLGLEVGDVTAGADLRVEGVRVAGRADLGPGLADRGARKPCGGGLLRLGPHHAGRPALRRLPVAQQRRAIEQVVVGDVGEGRPGDHAVVETRIAVGHVELRHRAARTAHAHQVAHVAVGFDQVLLGHHHRLGLHHHVAVFLVVLERGREHRVAARERNVVQHVRCRRLVVAGAAAAAVSHVDLVVPGRGAAPAIEGSGGIGEYRDQVLVAVHRAGFQPHDVGHGLALVGGRRRDVAGRARRVIGLEVAAARRDARLRAGYGGRRRGLVEEPEADGPVALRVERAWQAIPGLNLRPRKDRPADGMVGDGDHRTDRARQRRAQQVLAEQQARHHALIAPIGPQRELPGHVAAAEHHLHRRSLAARRQHDLDEGVVARDQVGAVRQYRDAQCLRRHRGDGRACGARQAAEGRGVAAGRKTQQATQQRCACKTAQGLPSGTGMAHVDLLRRT